MDLKRLWGLAKSLQTCTSRSPEKGITHLPVESQLLKQSAAQVKQMMSNILRATRHEDGVISDRRRVHEVSGDGVWYAIPYLIFSLNSLYAKVMSEGSLEIKEGWLLLISGIAKHYFRSIRNETPVVADYTEIPFLLFRSGGVDMYRNSLFSPSSFNATHELNLLNLILLQDQQDDFED